MLNAAKAYLATQVSTASQGDLLVMLYDTAVKHLRLSIEKMRAGDMAGKGILITKAITIISELQESLNKERGGEISKNLCQLYFFCNTRLLMANMKVKPEMVEEVITILSGLRQAFAQILPNQDGVASMTQPGVEAVANPDGAQPLEGSAAPVVPAAALAASAPTADAGAPDFSAALYVPAPMPPSHMPSDHAPTAAVPVAAAPEKKPSAPPLEATAAPESMSEDAPAPGQSARAPGLRLRAANAYATSR